jgi:RNA-binding protein
MLELTGTQRKALRGMAHGLRPLVQVGKEGLTAGVVAAVDRALGAHELIKVRFLGGRDDLAAGVAELEERLGCAAAGSVGHVAVLYRRHPDPERRRIELPPRARPGSASRDVR